MAVTTILLKAVAAAVDGYRTGGDVFVVASGEALDDLKIFEDSAEAESYLQTQGTGWEMFGPYTTPAASSGAAANLPISVQLTFADGSTETHTPETLEAVFLTEAAVDRFVIPYYASLRGIESAAEMRQQFRDGSLMLCCKTPWSVFFMDGESGEANQAL